MDTPEGGTRHRHCGLDAFTPWLPEFENHVATDHGPVWVPFPSSAGVAWVVAQVPGAQTVLRLPASSITRQAVLEISFVLFFGCRDEKGRGEFSLRAPSLLNGFKGKATSPAQC